MAALLATLCGTHAAAQQLVETGKRTVCTITVNSSDEADAFRRHLPASQYEFVELVERGRPEWLASACQKQVSCDVLIISGHFNGRTDFFSDRPDAREYLPVEEMERVSCSDSCPGLFTRLKEVYLFGCNTLNPAGVKSAPPEVARSLVRSGHSPAEAERLALALDARHGESSRERMQRIFMDVPVIYGFSSAAPLGARAGSLMNGYFQSGSATEVGSGRASPALLQRFATTSMTVARGLRASDSGAGFRAEVCQFVDERVSPAEKLRFIHGILGRDMAEVRMFFERIEGFFASLSESERQAPSFVQVQEEIAGDRAARERYLGFTEDADAAMRVRLIALAGSLGWLSAAEQRAGTLRMIGQLLERPSMGSADVDLICTLNRAHDLDREVERFTLAPAQSGKVAQAAGMACLGSAEGRARVLAALSSPDDKDVQIAEVYLGHRPISDVQEFRAQAHRIARMNASPAQVRALDTLGRHRLSDPDSLDAVAGIFTQTESVEVQRAVADLIIRSDYRALAPLEFARVLAEHRLKSPTGKDIIDILIRRLQSPASPAVVARARPIEVPPMW